MSDVEGEVGSVEPAAPPIASPTPGHLQGVVYAGLALRGRGSGHCIPLNQETGVQGQFPSALHRWVSVVMSGCGGVGDGAELSPPAYCPSSPGLSVSLQILRGTRVLPFNEFYDKWMFEELAGSHLRGCS